MSKKPKDTIKETPETSNYSISGYLPVYREVGADEKWMIIPTERVKGHHGVPAPACFGDALTLVRCYGHAQATALMWMFVAGQEAIGQRYKYETGLEERKIQIKTSNVRVSVQKEHPQKKDETLGDLYIPDDAATGK